MLGKSIKIRSSEGGEFDCYLALPHEKGQAPAIVLASAVHGVDDDIIAIAEEFAAHGAEIAAQADDVLARMRSINAGIRSKLRCATCGGPMDAKRISRRYCSDRCRQQAHRKAR